MDKKNKIKKIKKTLGVYNNFDLGEKVQSVKIDTNKYRKFNLIVIIALNILLFITFLYYTLLVFNALLLIICTFTFAACFFWSFFSYKKDVDNIKYTIYKNAIVKDFDSSKNIGELAKFTGIRKSRTMLDRIGKTKTVSVVVKFDNPWCSHIRLSCITEDADILIATIVNLSTDAKIRYEAELKAECPNNKKAVKKYSKYKKHCLRPIKTISNKTIDSSIKDERK